MDTANRWLAGSYVLTGPTASGKTELGLLLAQRLGAEIVSLDSMALYRGMDLGTAKPTAAQRSAVPHHLVDLVWPDEDFSVARYLEASRQAVEDIQQRGRRTLFIGGTPLYLKALLRGLFDGPPADWSLRHDLAETARAAGPGELHRRLAEVDPPTAARLHPNDTRRLIRALEVFAGTGRPISQWQTQFDAAPRSDVRVWSLAWPRAELHQRIASRVLQMLTAGWLEEVRALRAGFPRLSQTALQAVGYRELLEHLDGQRDLAATEQLITVRTRQFAKRQETWFRSLAECQSVAVNGQTDIQRLAGELVGQD